MKTALALTATLIALAACDSVSHPAAAAKCDKLRLTAAEYNDCVAKMSANESALESSQNLH